MDEWVTIIKIGGVAGSIYLQGQPTADGKWLYRRTTKEHALTGMLDGEDQDLVGMLERSSGVVDKLEDAVALLDRYPWTKMKPLVINPLFGEKVWDIVGDTVSETRYAHFWHQQCLSLARLTGLIKKSKHVVVFTGAGVSTESGLPDYRSADKGLWTTKDLMKYATVEAMDNDRANFVEFYRSRIGEGRQHEPNIGHRVLADWERRGIIQAVITQNIDGYHQRAGSRKVIELHGSADRFHCTECGKEFSADKYLMTHGERCECGGFVRPSVVLFGEDLPQDALLEAFRQSKPIFLL